MKGGIYELTIVLIFILLGSMLWVIIGYSNKNINENLKEIIPNVTAFNQTPEQDVKNVMDWPMNAFYIYLFFVSILAIIWAVKRAQVH